MRGISRRTERAPDTSRFRSPSSLYKASPDYAKLAPVDPAQLVALARPYRRTFRRPVASHSSSGREDQAGHPQWRSQWADRPRTADSGCRCSRACWRTPSIRLASSPAIRAKASRALHRQPLRDHLDRRGHPAVEARHARRRSPTRSIWRAYRAASRRPVPAVVVACRRRRDRRSPRASRTIQRLEAIVPLYDALRNVLARIPKRSTAVLTNSFRAAVDRERLGATFSAPRTRRARTRSTLPRSARHGRDQFYLAGLPERVIAEIIGWEEEQVAQDHPPLCLIGAPRPGRSSPS